jgi:catechol 2,3-dioxygenase-like lactoylglutathione lyase family enzyme
MVSNITTPHFTGGANIAMKCPSHTYDATVAFYRDTLALPVIEEVENGVTFQFGPVRLWIDKVPNISQPDIWLEIATNDTQSAARYLKVNGVPRRDEVEELHEDFDGFFISDPSGVVHLVVGEET